MSSKIIPSITATILLALPVITIANSKSEINDKISALSVMKKYAEAVSCSNSFENEGSLRSQLNNVYTMEREEEMGYSSHFILWYGDIGCNAGSGTVSFMVSEVVRLAQSRPFLVEKVDAFGEEFSSKINTRFIEDLKKVGDDKFIVVSYEFDKDDRMNFPSKKYLYSLNRLNSKWKVTGKKYLGKKEY